VTKYTEDSSNFGLVRSETANDLRILTAAGATSRVRRAITAATAGGLGLLGAVIGTAVAYLAAAAYFHNQIGQRLGHAPVTDLLLILVALPAVAAAGAWLLSGHQPSAVSHQPIE
jgi:putative ABC transport system permease protein